MDLRALKSSDKKAKSSLFQNIGGKIPISVRSPARMKVKPSATNTIVCSTPLNAARRNIFDDDNQQMSPICYTSPATASDDVSPMKLVDEKRLEKELGISKISEKKPQEKDENSVPSKKEIKESLYSFPLDNHVKVLKMIVCDSEDETIETNSRNTRRKDSKKTATSDIELRRKKSVVTDISKRSIRLTRSNSEITNKINNISNQNIPEKKDDKSLSKKITRFKSSSFPVGKKVDQNEFLSNVDLENSTIPLETIHKINKDILNDETKKSSNCKFIGNDNENKIVEGDFDLIFHCESNKNNEIVDTNSLPKNSSKNKKSKKDILNGNVAKTNQTNIQILKVSNTTKTDVIIHDNNFENITKNSNIKQDNSKNTNSFEPTKRGRIEAVNSEEIVKSNDALFSGPTSQINSNKTVNNNDVSNNIIVDKNKIFGNKTTDLTFGQALDIYGKSSEPKKRGRKPKTVNSKVTENSNNLRKSTRKRRSGYSKYWKIDKQEKKWKILENKSRSPVEKSPKTLKINKIQEPPEIEEIICNNTEEIKTSEVKGDKKLSKYWKTDKKEKNRKISENKSMRPVGKSPKTLKTSEIQEPPEIEEIICNNPKEIKRSEVKEDKKLSGPNKKLSTKRKSKKSKFQTIRKIRKSLSSNRLSKSPKKTVKKQNKLIENDTSYTTEEEYEISGDSLVSHITKINTEKELSRENKQKRKTKINLEITEPKKLRLQSNTSEISFKSLAIAANISTQVADLADVNISGNRCLLGCFGKFPQKYTKLSQNSDISIGISIDNGRITTGVIQIVPLGRKNYEYAKKVDLLFIVLEGIAQVVIGNTSNVLRIGQNFYVPKNTAYHILNLSSTVTLVMHFSKINKGT